MRLIPAFSAIDMPRARWTDAVYEVAEAHRALTVVVSPDQILDYPLSPIPEGEGEVRGMEKQEKRYRDQFCRTLM